MKWFDRFLKKQTLTERYEKFSEKPQKNPERWRVPDEHKFEVARLWDEGMRDGADEAVAHLKLWSKIRQSIPEITDEVADSGVLKIVLRADSIYIVATYE